MAEWTALDAGVVAVAQVRPCSSTARIAHRAVARGGGAPGDTVSKAPSVGRPVSGWRLGHVRVGQCGQVRGERHRGVRSQCGTRSEKDGEESREYCCNHDVLFSFLSGVCLRLFHYGFCAITVNAFEQNKEHMIRGGLSVIFSRKGLVSYHRRTIVKRSREGPGRKNQNANIQEHACRSPQDHRQVGG